MPNETWFPKFKNEMFRGAMNNNLCSYVVALEGWRRGLTLTWTSRKVRRGIHAPGRAFSLSSEERTHHFYKSRGDKVSSKSVKIAANKEETKELLESKGLRVPKGKRFTSETSKNEIYTYALELGFPLVIKPTNGVQGIGVISNITSMDFFEKSLEYVRDTLGNPDVIIEEHIQGEEYRVFVIEDEVLSVINRRPASVLGNGRDTLRKLIKDKNNERKKNPRLYSCLITIDFEVRNYLSEQNLTLEYIPKIDERVYLRRISNISRGGDSLEVKDEFPDEIKKVAINALKAFPKMPHGGVDIIIDDNKPIKDAGTIIEINGVPQIGSLVFPMIGKARDIPAAIIDYYFPETKGKHNDNIYFDFNEILRPLRNKTAREITVIDAPNDVELSVLYIVKGKVQNVNYRKWIRKQAIENDLHGYVQNRRNGNVHVVVSGSKVNVEKFREICSIGPSKASVQDVLVKSWSKPIKVGFEIVRSQKTKSTTKGTKTNTLNKVNKTPLTFKQRVKKKILKLLKK